MVSKSAVERFATGPGARRRRGAGFGVVLALLPVLLLLASASRGWAGPEEAEQAEALIKEGVQLRAQDQTARALPLFEKAYRLSRNPRTAGQLGLCELELGFFAEAELYLSEALATPNHPWIAKNRTTLKRQLDAARANVGELSLTVSPATAEVLLDKKSADKVVPGVPIHLRKGPVVVEIRAPGYQPVQTTITIVGGKREERTFALVPDSPPPVVPVAETSPSVTLPTDAPPAADRRRPTPGESPPGRPGVGRCSRWPWGPSKPSTPPASATTSTTTPASSAGWRSPTARRSACRRSASRSRTTTIGRSRFRSSASSRRGRWRLRLPSCSSSPRPVMSATRSAPASLRRAILGLCPGPRCSRARL